MYMTRVLEKREKISRQTIIKSNYLELQFCYYIQSDIDHLENSFKYLNISG